MCDRPGTAVPKPKMFICGCGRDFTFESNGLNRHRRYCNFSNAIIAWSNEHAKVRRCLGMGLDRVASLIEHVLGLM